MDREQAAIVQFAIALGKNFKEHLRIRTENFHEGDGFETSTNSVFSALLARQASLAIGLVESPSTWNAHVAPLVLRSMVDLSITYRWIALDPSTRSSEYISYGLGTEKLLVAHFQDALKKDPDNEQLARMIEANLAWIEGQMFQMFVSVNLGSWSGMSTRKMCEEIGDPEIYKYSFAPFSSAVHNTWGHVGKWNAKTCDNPLHKQHSIGTIVQLWPVLEFVSNAAEYYQIVISEFDRYYEFTNEHEAPSEAFERHYDILARTLSDDED